MGHALVKNRHGLLVDLQVSPATGFSQEVRKRIEQVFGWAKTVAGFRRTRATAAKRRTQFVVHLVGAAYNLLRVARLRLPAAT
ncbi:MAG: hypothetical protein KA297_04720 [Kofleriaceae bacterium]|nr:hypothetical protein [Kofleriaceae bacterium]MBP6837015.1 hypothetical protein [Kofleriaceae bacterium]